MNKTKMELNHTAIATVLRSIPQEAIALLPRNGSSPTTFKLKEKTQLATMISDLSEAGKTIAQAYLLDYGFRFLEMEEICVFLPVKVSDGNEEVRDRLKMNLVGTFSVEQDNDWCYYSLSKEAYLNRGRIPEEIELVALGSAPRTIN